MLYIKTRIKVISLSFLCGTAGIGRQTALRSLCSLGRVGSSPTFRTMGRPGSLAKNRLGFDSRSSAMMIVRIPPVIKWIPPQYRRVSAMAKVGSKTDGEVNTMPRWRLKDGVFCIPFHERNAGGNGEPC